MRHSDSEAIIRPRKKDPLLADALSQLCHAIDQNSSKWSADVRAKFNSLYSKLSDIDAENA